MEACENGEIKAGRSVLAIEAVDRISRLPVEKTREIWSDLREKYKVDVAVQKWGIVFKHNEDLELGSDLMLTAAFHLARMESDQKSTRIRYTKEQRRLEASKPGGKKRTSISPAWLKLSDDKLSFHPIPEKVAVLEKIFDLKLNQGLGPDAIARKLNSEKVPNFTNNGLWHHGTVRGYLKNRAIIGESQPKLTTKDIDQNGKRIDTDDGPPITDYFPTVIDKDIFLATQATFKSTPHGRKEGRVANLFRGILKCPKCRYSMSTLYSSRKSGIKQYVKCSRAIKSECPSKQQPYEGIESILINILSTLNIAELFRKTTNSEIMNRIDRLENKKSALSVNANRCIQLAKLTDIEEAQKELIIEHDRDIRKANFIAEEIAKLKQDLIQGTDYQLLGTNELDLTDDETRLKINNYLIKRLISICIEDRYIHLEFRNEQKLTLYLLDTDFYNLTPEMIMDWGIFDLIRDEAYKKGPQEGSFIVKDKYPVSVDKSRIEEYYYQASLLDDEPEYMDQL